MARTPPAHPAAPASDTNWGLTVAILITIALVALLIGGWMFSSQPTPQETRQQRDQAVMLEQYRQNTAPPAQPPTLPASYLEAKRIEEKLLNHPAVTPGPGFYKPGVQSTGNAIVDAMDQASLAASPAPLASSASAR